MMYRIRAQKIMMDDARSVAELRIILEDGQWRAEALDRDGLRRQAVMDGVPERASIWELISGALRALGLAAA